MSGLRIGIAPGGTGCTVTHAEAFPEATFIMSFPESIGDADHVVHFPHEHAAWQREDGGDLVTRCRIEGELDYTIRFSTGPDYVDAYTTLTNLSGRAWAQSLAFNCVHPGSCQRILDYECLRHFTGYQGRPTPLRELPRIFGPRPVVQLYDIAGMPKGSDTAFVKTFEATPDIEVENWLAIVSPDTSRLMGVVSLPALFLFHNLEYSCIHAAQSLGGLAPGQSGRAMTRAYFTEMAIDAWHLRVEEEFGAITLPGRAEEAPR